MFNLVLLAKATGSLSKIFILIPGGKNFRLTAIDLIEIQSGSYVGEDDIVRFEDVYGRKD